jgi:hypothetical protein
MSAIGVARKIISGSKASAKEMANVVPDNRLLDLGFSKGLSKKQIETGRKKYQEALQSSTAMRDREAQAFVNDFADQFLEAEVPAKRIIQPESLLGTVGVGVAGDRSSIGTLRQVGGLLIDDVPVEGGQRFARLNTPEGVGWASNKSIADRMQKKFDEVSSMTDMPVRGIYNAMGPQSIDFSTPPAEALARLMQSTPLTKTSKESFNKQIRAQFPDFVGVDSPDLIAQLRGDIPTEAGSTGNLRKLFADRSQLAPYRDAGFPSFEQVRKLIEDPELRRVEIGDAGTTIFTPTTGAKTMPTTRHLSYDTEFAGTDAVGLEVPVPFEVMFPDVNATLSQEVAKSGRPLTRGERINAFNTRGAGGTGAFQVFDERVVKGIQDYIDAVRLGKPIPQSVKSTVVGAGILTASQANAGIIPDELESMLQPEMEMGTGRPSNFVGVPAEFGAGVADAVVGTLDFLGPDTINAVAQLAGSERRVPRLGDQPAVRRYTQGGYLPQGTARDVVYTAGGLLSPF